MTRFAWLPKHAQERLWSGIAALEPRYGSECERHQRDGAGGTSTDLEQCTNYTIITRETRTDRDSNGSRSEPDQARHPSCGHFPLQLGKLTARRIRCTCR
jgi:hypothetical protein